MSGRRPRLWCLVPVLDEAPNLERVFGSLADLAMRAADEHDLAVVLVDDGSTDGSGEVARGLAAARDLDLTVLAHPTNLGPGRAFATAFAHLAERLDDDDRVATIEGDNTSRVELLLQMRTRMKEGYDVVFASPYMYGGGIANTALHRVLLSHLANGFVKEALEIRGIVTMSSFFRLYRGAVVRRLQSVYGPGIVERAGFENAIELLMKLIAIGASISEVAMLLDTSRRVGKSKMKILRTGLGYMSLWRDKPRWRARARRAGFTPMGRPIGGPA